MSTAPAMRVACFLFDTRVGGPHVCANVINGQLAARGHDARIVIPDGPGNARAFFENNGVPVDQIAIAPPASPSRIRAFLRFALNIPLGVLRVRTYLRRHRIQVIRVNGALDIVPVIGGWLARVPVILYLNDTVFPPRFSRNLARFLGLFTTRTVAAATRVGQHYGLDMSREQVIFEPVNTERFQPRPAGDFPRARPVLGLIANWNRIKCQERFIDMIAALRAGGLDVRGRIVGGLFDSQESYWKPLLEQIETEGLSDAIEVLGFVDDTPTELAGFDLLLLTSRSEACPVCVLEAMASGVPVVASDVGGVTEMLDTDSPDPAGIAVTEGDVAAMTRTVRDLLADPVLYQAMAQAGPRRVAAEFSLETCVDRHEALCAELVRES